MATTTMQRPQRWDQPFEPGMTDADVQRLLSIPEIAGIDKKKFPAHVPLEGILKNDSRIVKYKEGDIVIREGDYGNSAFLILSGKLHVVLAPGLPPEMLGRRTIHKKNLWEALSQLWTNRKIPEVRDIGDIHQKTLAEGQSRVFLQDIPVVLDSRKTAILEQGALFGELAALGRTPRTSTVFAETEAEVLEIRWQGLRELRKYDDGWRRIIEERYRKNALSAYLGATSLFSHLDDTLLQEVADATLFETYGKFDWNVSYKKLQNMNKAGEITDEPVIANQGDYPDGILLVRTGFARVSINRGSGQQTITYLGTGDFYGADELYASWNGKPGSGLKVSITALGYVEILRVPTKIAEKHLFAYWESERDGIRASSPAFSPASSPTPPKKYRRIQDLFNQTLSEGAILEWAVQERFINGTQAMLINLDRCVRCDDCVRACAETHGGNPRFIRHGKIFKNWMVANACMHCADPVCMIGCPTGAIHRTLSGGMVVINDDTCIGCETCANSCPYSNIRMTSIRDQTGQVITDPENQKPIIKATKCDLCVDQISGPACVFACPHDALKRVNFREVAIGDDI